MKVELDLSNYAKKADLKNVAGVETSKFAKYIDLADLESIVYKLDIDKIINAPTNLYNLKSKVDHLFIDLLMTPTYSNYSAHHFKVSENYLFLLMMLEMIMKQVY